MRLRYYPETDTLSIHLADRPGADADEIAPDVVVDYDADGRVVALEIEHASKFIDLGDIQLDGLPAGKAAARPAANAKAKR